MRKEKNLKGVNYYLKENIEKEKEMEEENNL